jgi:ribonuclease HI
VSEWLCRGLQILVRRFDSGPCLHLPPRRIDLPQGVRLFRIDINTRWPIKNLMGKSATPYDVWCDGSYRDSHDKGGAGWVIRYQGEFKEGFCALPALDKPYRPHGSDIAEATAVMNALSLIPPQSAVLLRMDCENMLQWLKAGRIKSPKKADITPLQDMFAQAHSLAATMASVEFIQITGRNNEQMNRAHELSRRGSSPLINARK